MLEHRTLANGWAHFVSKEVEVFPEEATKQAQALLSRWEGIYPKEGTWVGAKLGVPSLFVRLDCMWDQDRGLGVCEVEERPCGMGGTQGFNPAFADRLNDVRAKWPTFSWVKDPDRVTDDELWLGPGLTLREALERKAQDPSHLFLVRSRPEKSEYYSLEDRAVSSVSREGNKAYGEALGLWSRSMMVSEGGLAGERYLSPALPGSCVVKPPVGTRARDVRAYVAPQDRERVVCHRSERNPREIERMARQYAHVYVQRLIQPMHLDHLATAQGFERHNAIYRMYFGFDPQKHAWEPLGGAWTASRESVIVHGTKGTVMGPLVPQ